jgi:hypothetical protein
MSTNFTDDVLGVIYAVQSCGRSAARIFDSSSRNAVNFSSARTTNASVVAVCVNNEDCPGLYPVIRNSLVGLAPYLGKFRALNQTRERIGVRKELDWLPGSDVHKVASANLVLERTVARQSWIAGKLATRSAANVSQQVRRYRAKRSRLIGA